MDLLTISPSQSFWKQNHLLDFPPSCQFYPSMATEGGFLAGSWTDGEMMLPSPRRTSDDRSTKSLPYSISTGERVARHSLSTDSQTSQEYPETQMVYSDQDMDVNPAGGTNNIGVCGDFGQLADFRQYLYNGSDKMQGDLVDHTWMGRSQYIADDLSFMFPSHQRECEFSSPTSLTNIKRSMPSAHKEICAGCQRPIEDRFLLKVMEFSWHEHCVVCSICHAPLSGTCYQRDRKFFCKLDYDKMYRHPCNGCGMHVGSNELVMRAQGFIYHLHCFACVECGQHLKQGDYYALHEGQLFCRLDHEREFMMNLSPKSDDSESYEDCESDGGKHPKRPRTILTTSQRRKFKSAFELNPKPCRKVREQLAAETGLSVRVVQVWFQNQRAKVKKLARRQSQDGNSKNNSGKSKGGDVNKNENCKHETKKEYKDDDDDQDCLKRLGEDESLGSLISESRHHGNVEQISPIPASEYQDSHFGNTMDIGNTVRQTLDDSMTCLDHMFVGEGVPNTASIENNGVVNPIDKLYSMQSSYFSIE